MQTRYCPLVLWKNFILTAKEAKTKTLLWKKTPTFLTFIVGSLMQRPVSHKLKEGMLPPCYEMQRKNISTECTDGEIILVFMTER